MSRPDIGSIIKSAIEQSRKGKTKVNSKPWNDTRTERSIINTLLEELCNDRRFSGKFVSGDDFEEARRQLILLEVQDEQFGNALKTIATKVLEKYPPNHHLDEKGKEREGDGEYGDDSECDVKVHAVELN